MKRFLAIVRRVFAGGIVGLALAIALANNDVLSLVQKAIAMENLQSYFCIYFLASPIFYLLFLIISTLYIRNKGTVNQYTGYKTPFFKLFFLGLGKDLIAGFSCLREFIVGTIFGHYNDMYTPEMKSKARKIAALRFIWMLFMIFVILVGVGSLIQK